MSEEHRPEGSEHYVALFDRHGVVGIYAQNTSQQEVNTSWQEVNTSQQEVNDQSDLPTIMIKFADKPGCEFIYVIPLNDSPAPAYITSDPKKATRARDLYASVGWTCDDDIEYWKYPVGEMCEPAKRRRAQHTQNGPSETSLSAEEIDEVLTKIEDAEQAIADNSERATVFWLDAASVNTAPVDIVALIGPSSVPEKIEGPREIGTTTPP